jgi:hypothetical protein
MDKKSKIFFFVFSLIIIVSLLMIFDRYIIKKDFEYFTNDTTELGSEY